ncbi:MAG: TetR/AcrR family transcriptional regulator [Gammaproteobacteria bacterium]|nr:TetR/AcrR family transcriptional regulator [Gammaproteobacteria bacterium]
MNGLTERRLEEKERRRIEILDAAEAVAEVVGIEAMTMDQVARKARLSRALIYLYVQDKSDLILAICERALKDLHQRFELAATTRLLGIEKVDVCGRAYVTFAAELPARFEALALLETYTTSGQNEHSYKACIAAGNRVQGVLVTSIEQGLRDGSIRSDAGSPTLIGFVLWGLMHGLIQLTITKKGNLQDKGLDAKQLIEQGFVMATWALSPERLKQ